jgi:hypothetical protein
LDDTTLTRLASYPFHDIRLMAKATEEAKELIDADPLGTEVGRVDLQSTSCILWSVLDKFVKTYKLREKKNNPRSGEEAGPIHGLSLFLTELCHQDKRIPIKNVISAHLGMPQALLMKAAKYPEQVEEWGAKGVAMLYDGYKRLGREKEFVDLIGSRPHSLALVPHGSASGTQALVTINAYFNVSGLAVDQVEELKAQMKMDASRNSQEINDLKGEIRELRELMVEGSNNCQARCISSTTIQPTTAIITGHTTTPDHTWLTRDQVRTAVDNNVASFIHKTRLELCTHIEGMLGGKLRSQQLQSILRGTDFVVDSRTKCISARQK